MLINLKINLGLVGFLTAFFKINLRLTGVWLKELLVLINLLILSIN
jgi:hypothetical protein